MNESHYILIGYLTILWLVHIIYYTKNKYQCLITHGPDWQFNYLHAHMFKAYGKEKYGKKRVTWDDDESLSYPFLTFVTWPVSFILLFSFHILVWTTSHGNPIDKVLLFLYNLKPRS